MRGNPLHVNDLIEVMTVDDSKEVHNDEGEIEAKKLVKIQMSCDSLSSIKKL